MSHAQTCPICDGKGRIKDPNYDPAATGVPNDVTCHGCNGKGWVEVGTSFPHASFWKWLGYWGEEEVKKGLK